MALERFDIQLAIPKATWDAIPTAKKVELRDAIRWLQSRSVKINEGQPNEEDTTIARRQTCRHDEGGACSPWQEI